MLRVLFAVVALVLALGCAKQTPVVSQTPEPKDPVEDAGSVEDGAR
jgi:hypothetical protein